MKQLFKFFTSTRFVLIISFLINVALFFITTLLLGYYYYAAVSLVATIVAIIFLARSKDDPYYKVYWILIMLVVPFFGVILYVYLKSKKVTNKQLNKWNKISSDSLSAICQKKEPLALLKNSSLDHVGIANYISNTTGMSVTQNNQLDYLKNGEVYFESLLKDLKQAKKFILIEYFIIKPGKVWDSIIAVLKEKSQQGVEIKLLYDDFGCLDRFPKKYLKQLQKDNIQTAVFNKIIPTVNPFINYRDHRKIVVIDGKVAYTGGINLADEYANYVELYGKWKDSGIRIAGDCVWNIIVMFFYNWRIATKQDIDLSNYKKPNNTIKNNQLVQFFCCGPLDNEAIARNNYLNMINSSKKELTIVSPYFVVDQRIIDALKICAHKGVKIKIVLPGIPDKKWVFYLARSYYEELIKLNVQIYEYTPGFVHAKMVVVDGCTASIGTINFDFRSLYLHFENLVVLYNTDCIQDMSKDIEELIRQSHLMTLADLKKRSLGEKFIANILKLLEPLL